MKKYLKQRYRNYITLVVGLLIGFIVSGFLFDRPDYKTAASYCHDWLAWICGDHPIKSYAIGRSGRSLPGCLSSLARS